jgi:hypothetical protein
VVEVDNPKKNLKIYQELTYFNQSNDTLSRIVLNDWNNAYSDKNTPLGFRFSDEFVRSFHLATEKERGNTNSITITDDSKSELSWSRPAGFPDLVQFQLKKKLLPGQKTTFFLSYYVKIPDDTFTSYGANPDGSMSLKNWFLTPSRYEDKSFVMYNNLNIDDIPNALTNIDLEIKNKDKNNIICDLPLINQTDTTYNFSGTNLLTVNVTIDKRNTFLSFKNAELEVTTNIEDKRVDDIRKALIIDKVVNYVSQNLGRYPKSKITITQADYLQNPFYGLNQLPPFIRPFPDDFIYELKFLKTYLNNYLKTTLQVDSRKDNWIFDAIQVYYMIKYIEEYYPNIKMMGSIAKYKLLKGYHLVSLDFNDQYSYFYMLMARKNLDQPLGDPKNTLLKFNEQIASKYRAGLSFKYLSDYIGEDNLKKTIREFINYAILNQTNSYKFESFLKQNTAKETDWFFNTIINTRKIIDYKFNTVTKTNDSLSFTLKNNTGTFVPIPIYGIKNKKVVFKEWIDKVNPDSTYTFKRYGADKIVINYKNIVPEYNLRNNWRSLKPYSLFNRPIKFSFMKDLEDPNYNQVLYVPTLEYNLYDGFIPGMRFHNRTLLDKPYIIDLIPSYSTKTKSFSGRFTLAYNQSNRESTLFNIRYGLGGEYYHYAPDAYYKKINPFISFRFREKDYRDNQGQNLVLRQVYVNRDPSQFVTTSKLENYSVFNIRFSSGKTEVRRHFAYFTDLQFESQFGKASGNISYRRLFDNNRQINFRIYAGAFFYNNTQSDYFSFAIDRPTDYLFDYNYIGRSESSGLFSQEFYLSEGGFKSKVANPFANQWLTTSNISFNIWNWIEIYGDFGLMKNKYQDPTFIYDNGVRLNLVTDYFELFFPVYSNNGWEISQSKYAEKIRFTATFSPQILIGLFTRKWF